MLWLLFGELGQWEHDGWSDAIYGYGTLATRTVGPVKIVESYYSARRYVVHPRHRTR